MIRLSIIMGFVLLGLSIASSQESTRAMQTVTFGVHRANVPSHRNQFSHHETNHESSRLKVTVAPDRLFERSKEDPLPGVRSSHLDVSVVHSKILESTIKGKTMLVTITN